MRHHIFVAKGVWLANRSMWIVANGVGGIVRGDQCRQASGAQIVERWLAAFLMPRRAAHIFGTRQTLPFNQPAHIFIVPNFIGRFKQRIDDAVGGGGEQIERQNEGQWKMSSQTHYAATDVMESSQKQSNRKKCGVKFFVIFVLLERLINRGVRIIIALMLPPTQVGFRAACRRSVLPNYADQMPNAMNRR